MLVPEINGPLSDALQALLWLIEYLSIHNNSKNNTDFIIFYPDFIIFYPSIGDKLFHGKMK